MKEFKIKHFWLLFSLLIFICVSIIVGTTSYIGIHSFLNDPIKLSKPIYKLKAGQTSRNVVKDLSKNSFYAFVTNIYLRNDEKIKDIKKGDYLIDGKKSAYEILLDMVEGNVVQKIYPVFAIVEGTNLEKIIQKANKRNLNDKKFEKLIKNQKDFIREALKDHKDLLELVHDLGNLEGLLAPATYPMYEENPLFKMVQHAIIRQLNFLNKEWKTRVENEFIKTPYDALILASLIESETLLDEERPTISAVFLNRLEKGMRLQTDPSVMYGASKNFQGKLTRSILKKDTPYNTYTRYGLPPTPISMPREASIKAALHPNKSDAIYFVAKGISPKDGHVFSSNLKDHNNAVSNYRKLVREYYKSQNKSDSDDDLIEAEAEANQDNKSNQEEKQVKTKKETTKESSKNSKKKK